MGHSFLRHASVEMYDKGRLTAGKYIQLALYRLAIPVAVKTDFFANDGDLGGDMEC